MWPDRPSLVCSWIGAKYDISSFWGGATGAKLARGKVVWEGMMGDIPGLKNIYRIVAVFLCTLKGWPVRMMRFAMTRLGSGFMNDPAATSSGAKNKGLS